MGLPQRAHALMSLLEVGRGYSNATVRVSPTVPSTGASAGCRIDFVFSVTNLMHVATRDNYADLF